MSEHVSASGRLQHHLVELLAGGGLGLLVGCLIGLSVSQVVGAVVGALTALAAAFFGLTAEARAGSARLVRIAAFAFAAVLGVLGGLSLRTHDTLAESLEDRIDEWTAAGYPQELARTLVVYERTGLVPSDWAKKDDPKAPPAGPPRGSTVLFGASAEQCAGVDPERFPEADELANAFALAGGAWADVARLAGGAQRREVLEAAWRLACSTE